MHVGTGELVDDGNIKKLIHTEKKNFIKVRRDLTQVEILNKQVMLYAPCVCGSGKKFKFCCNKPW